MRKEEENNILSEIYKYKEVSVDYNFNLAQDQKKKKID